MSFRVSAKIMEDTFALFRQCGRGEHECQVLWVSPWDLPDTITEVVHPKHRAGAHGFVLDDDWLNAFWLRLAAEGAGVRVQVHTHPFDAFHSKTDDEYPIIASSGFLSLVIPNFAQGAIGFDGAYLAEIQRSGQWRQVPIAETLILV